MLAKTTLSDVAGRVGVSASTISRVLNGAPGVNGATRRKVLTAVHPMNYQPGAASRESGQSPLIGFPMPINAEQWGVRSNFIDENLRAINDTSAHHNYAATVGSYHPALGDKPEDEIDRARPFRGRSAVPHVGRGVRFRPVSRAGHSVSDRESSIVSCTTPVSASVRMPVSPSQTGQ
jgi:hypothetical protein